MDNEDIMANVQSSNTKAHVAQQSVELGQIDVSEIRNHSVGAKIDPQDYTPYQPDGFNYNDAARIEEIGTIASKIKVKTRLTREGFILVTAVIIVILNEIFRDDGYDETDLSFTFGITMIMVIISYFSHLGMILGGFSAVKKDKYLHRMYSLNTNKENWANMTLTFGCISFKYSPILSISELSAVHGGQANTMLTIFSSYCWCLGCCAIATEQFNSNDYSRYWTSDVFFTLLGGFGLTFVGSFELDQLSDTMVKFHYLGAGLCVCTWIALALQSIKLYIATDGDYIYGIILSIIFIIIVVICFPLWLYWQGEAEKFAKNENNIRSNLNDKEIAAKVTEYSLKCVGAEASFLCALALSCATWLMQAGMCRENECANIWD